MDQDYPVIAALQEVEMGMFAMSVATAILLSDPVKHPSPEDIVKKAIQEAGGKERLAYDHFWYRDRGVVVSLDGKKKAPFTTEFWYRDTQTIRYRSEFVLGRDRVIVDRVLNGNKAWEDVNGAVRQFDDARTKELRNLAISCYTQKLYPLIEGQEFSLKYLGEKKLDGRDVHRILVEKQGYEGELYFEKKSGRLLGSGSSEIGPKGKPEWSDVIFLEMAQINGFAVPKKIRMTVEGKEYMEREVVDWKAMKSFPERTFDLPKKD